MAAWRLVEPPSSLASSTFFVTRLKEQLEIAAAALARAEANDLAVAANELRTAAEAIGGILGKIYSDDLPDSIFSRFLHGEVVGARIWYNARTLLTKSRRQRR